MMHDAKPTPIIDDGYASRVRDDHYAHRLVHIALSIWGGWAWGWAWGVAAFLILFLVIGLTNSAILIRTGNFKLVRINRWLWLVALLAVIIFSTASIGQVR